MPQPDGREVGTRAVPNSALRRDAAEQLARTLQAIADPTRLQILSFIHGSPGGESMVKDLTDYLGLRQPTVTYHLRVMAAEGLVVRRAEGRRAWFSIAPDRLESIADLLD